MTRQWKRRGPVASPRHGLSGTEPVVVAAVPPRCVAGRSARLTYQKPRRRKLSPEQEAAIRAEAGTRSLRELAAEFGVSHETVRSVLRDERRPSSLAPTPRAEGVPASRRRQI